MGQGWVLERVHSGGQVGVNQVALEVAQFLSYKTGGIAPKHWRTDAGPAPWLQSRYGLVESGFKGYGPRTDANVYHAEATVWFGLHDSAGRVRTFQAIARYKKPSLTNPSVSELQDFILHGGFRIINVAGHRLRTHPEAAATARVVLTAGLLPF